MKGRRYGHLHTSDGDAMVQLHRPSLSEMTVNYISNIVFSGMTLQSSFLFFNM